jgi:hypothetical protein
MPTANLLATSGWKPIEPEWDALPRASALVLLPVRLECRFERVAPDRHHLKLRVYPDVIHTDLAISAPTELELAAAAAFQADGGPAAFTALTRVCGSPWRALAVAEALARPTVAAKRPLARARLLPHRWLATGFDTRGVQLFRVHGKPIPEDLALHPDWERLAASGLVDGPTGLPLDDPARWVVNFDAAIDVGMGLRIELPAGSSAVARLVVLGIRGDGDDSDLLAELLTTHLRTDGLAIVGAGTPTNNTEVAPSGFDPEREAPGYAALTREAPRPTPPPQVDGLLQGAAGAALARALVLPRSVLPLLPGADREFDVRPGAAQRLAWTTAIGPALTDLLRAPDAQVGEFHARWVRPDGPLPLLRVGTQPYGVLPICARREPDPEGLESLLHALRSHWRAAVPLVPRVDPSADDTPSDEPVSLDALIAVLQRHPHPTGFSLRELAAPSLTSERDPPGIREAMAALNARRASLADVSDGWSKLIADQIDQRVDEAWGTPLDTLLAAKTLEKQSGAAAALAQVLQRFKDNGKLPALTAWHKGASAEVKALQVLLVAAQAPERTLRDVGLAAPLTGALQADSPLALELGHADSARAWSAPLVGDSATWLPPLIRKLRDEVSPSAPVAGQPLLQQLLQVRGHSLVAKLLGARIRGSTKGARDRRVRDEISLSSPELTALRSQLDRLCDALDVLVTAPPAELDELLRAALGTGAHRLDAWITGVATMRLSRVLAAQLGAKRVAGRVGGYGVLLDLRPDPRKASGGHVLAPSLTHARMAALLRSGYAAHGDAGGLAVDLSSGRVALARWIFDGVRQGQALGDLLGERLERGLQRDGIAGLIPAFRRAVLDGLGRTDDPPHRVVDGFVLARAVRVAWQRAEPVDASEKAVAKALGSVDLARAERALRELDDALDALADTSLADALHGLLEGDEARVRATLEAVDRGKARPPTLEGLALTRGGRAVHHHVAILLPPAPAVPGPGLGSVLAPQLEAWLGQIIGAEPRFAIGVGEQRLELSLAELGGGHLDLLALAPGGVFAGSALERLLHALLLDRGMAPPIDPLPTPGAAPALAELLAALASAGQALARATPLGPAELSVPAAPALVAVPDDAPARHARLLARLDGLAALARRPAPPTAPELAAARLLLTALTGAPLPLPPAADPELRTWLLAATTAAHSRVAATKLADLRALAGESLPVVQAWVAPTTSGWLWDGTPSAWRTPVARGVDVTGWLDQLAPTRPALAALSDTLLASDSLGGAPGEATAFQSPAAGPWIGTNTPTAETGDTTSLVLLGVTRPPAEGLCGLVIDGFVERIPATLATAGLTFHWDAPAARPPQAILSVCPAADAPWSPLALTNLIIDTIRLAQERMVGPEDLLRQPTVGPGHFLPLLTVPDDVTPGLQFAHLLEAFKAVKLVQRIGNIP